MFCMISSVRHIDVMQVTWIPSVKDVSLVMLNGSLLYVHKEEFFIQLVENKFYKLHQLK